MEFSEGGSEQPMKDEICVSNDVNLISNESNDSITDAKIKKVENCASSEHVHLPRSKRELKRELRLQKRLKMKPEWK